MPIHRGPRLDDYIVRLQGGVIPAQANIIQTFPRLANPVAFGPFSVNNTFTAWSEMVSAANAPATPFVVFAVMNRGYAGNSCIAPIAEIGIGAAGSEVSIGYAIVSNGMGPFYVDPLYVIPGGSRVASRMKEPLAQGSTAELYLLTSLVPPSIGTLDRLRQTRKTGVWYPGTLGATGGSWAESIGNIAAANWAYGAVVQKFSSAQSEQNDSLIVEARVGSAGADVYAQVALTYGAGDTVLMEVPAQRNAPGTFTVVDILLPFPIRMPGAQKWGVKAANSSASAVNVIHPGWKQILTTYQP